MGFRRNNQQTPVSKEADGVERGVRYSDGDDDDNDIIHSDGKVGTSSFPDTPTTIMTSPTIDSYESPSLIRQSPSTDQTITLEHSLKTDKGTAVRKWSKPFIALIGSVALLGTGSAAYLFSEWLSIPGLKTQVQKLEKQVQLLEGQVDELTFQVDRLEEQVDRLEGQVGRLENETDRYAFLNDELQRTLGNYTNENSMLNESLALFTELNQQFNQSIVELRFEVSELEKQVDIYSLLNDNLNGTARQLATEVVRLEKINDELSQTNRDLSNTVTILSNEITELSAVNDGLNNTVVELEDELVVLSSEIDRLDSLSTNLATVVSFIDATTITIDSTVDRFTEYLANEITRTRIMAMDALRNNYQQANSFWNCGFAEHFLAEPFVQNRNIPIGDEDSFMEVIDYLDQHVLRTLCLDPFDFLDYLGIGSAVSFNNLLNSVGAYTDLAMDYYFPLDASSSSLNPTVWAEARHTCNNLPPELRFRVNR